MYGNAADFNSLIQSVQGASIERVLFCDSPISLVLAEHIRQLLPKTALGNSSPCQRILFGNGCPVERHMTKVNGLPYRPKDAPWPLSTDSAPLEFVMQINFSESRDIVGSTPGDVLLMFSDTVATPFTMGHRIFAPLEPGSLYFEWQALGHDERTLVDSATAPTGTVQFPHCHGVLFNTEEFADGNVTVGHLEQLSLPCDIPTHKYRQKKVCECIEKSARSKIGGRPFWYNADHRVSTGRFLGSFGGVVPAFDVPYPWTNQETPIALDSIDDEEIVLAFGDRVVINIFLRDDGNVEWIADYA